MNDVDPPGSLRVFVDADVLIASAASPQEYSAGQVLLTLSEVTLLTALTSELVVEECRRNIEASFQRSAEVRQAFQQLVEASLDIVSAPPRETVLDYHRFADWADAPHLASAVEHECRYLVTYNTSDYQSGNLSIDVTEPGPLVRRIRRRLATL
jgi:predicted nucleic acid-binding protein